MDATDLLPSVVAGAFVVISGGLYALLLALARMRSSQVLARLSLAAYLGLVFCTFVLAESLALSPAWYAVIGVMLLGYWLAPKVVWHLSVSTHEPEARR